MHICLNDLSPWNTSTEFLKPYIVVLPHHHSKTNSWWGSKVLPLVLTTKILVSFCILNKLVGDQPCLILLKICMSKCALVNLYATSFYEHPRFYHESLLHFALTKQSTWISSLAPSIMITSFHHSFHIASLSIEGVIPKFT